MDMLIAPSLLSCDFSRLSEEVAAVAGAGADLIHADVMDGHFVPNLTIGLPVVECLKRVSPLPLDTHLMITHPLCYAPAFARAGSDYVVFHIESDDDPAETIAAIRAAGGKPGLALKPATPAERLFPYLRDLGMVVIMTVEPGFGGQRFMANQMPKVRAVRDKIRADGLSCRVEVDGGVNPETAQVAVEAGADVLVAGSAVFGKPDYAAAIAALRA